MFKPGINEAFVHGFNWNGDDALYSELQIVVLSETLSAVVFYCFWL